MISKMVHLKYFQTRAKLRLSKLVEWQLVYFPLKMLIHYMYVITYTVPFFNAGHRDLHDKNFVSW
jgi:hypothetical protein